MKVLEFIREEKLVTTCIILIFFCLSLHVINLTTAEYPILTSCYTPNSLPLHYSECHQWGKWTLLDFSGIGLIFILIGGFGIYKLRD